MRVVALIAGVQMLCTVLGYFALGLIMKLNGYPGQNPAVEWSPLASFLRRYGLGLLLLPLLWGCLAVAVRQSFDRLWSERKVNVIGVLFAALLLLIYLYAMIYPYSVVRLHR